jgi:hypothetical protein
LEGTAPGSGVDGQAERGGCVASAARFCFFFCSFQYANAGDGDCSLSALALARCFCSLVTWISDLEILNRATNSRVRTAVLFFYRSRTAVFVSWSSWKGRIRVCVAFGWGLVVGWWVGFFVADFGRVEMGNRFESMHSTFFLEF